MDKTHSKSHARQKKTALALATQLEKSVKAMREYISACHDCGDQKVLNADDGRQRLSESMDEYGAWLGRVFSADIA